MKKKPTKNKSTKNKSMKRKYVVELKVKETNGQHYNIVDQYKKISPEAAVTLLTRKYVSREGRKGLMQQLDKMYDELVNDIEIALKIR